MNRKRMQDETLNFAITCLASVFRTDDVIEVAGHPWSREERLADPFGTADQIAWKAATLVGGRFVTAAVVRPLIRMCCNFVVELKVWVNDWKFSSSPRTDRE